MKAAVKRSLKPTERRLAPRRQPAIGTVCRFAPSARMGEVGLVWNISTTGVSVLANKPCTPGIRLEGELTTLDQAASLPISFHVAHVKELGTGDYVIAGPFPRSLSRAKIKPFIAVPSRGKRPKS